MIKETVQGAVDEETLAAFLGTADKYIRGHPLVVDDRKVTLAMLKDKPFLYVPCQVRARSGCPDQESSLPSCDRCTHAEASAKTLHQIGPQNGFIIEDHSSRYSGTGTLMRLGRHARNNDPLSFVVDGDEGGVATVHLHWTRRAYK